MAYTNAQKLAAVLADWARPAVQQIASAKMGNLPVFASISNTLAGVGIIPQGYNIAKEIEPFVASSFNALVFPLLSKQLGNIPDESIPALAHSICDEAIRQPQVSLFDGLITFEQCDLNELKNLLNKNLPIQDGETYELIK